MRRESDMICYSNERHRSITHWRSSMSQGCAVSYEECSKGLQVNFYQLGFLNIDMAWKLRGLFSPLCSIKNMAVLGANRVMSLLSSNTTWKLKRTCPTSMPRRHSHYVTSVEVTITQTENAARESTRQVSCYVSGNNIKGNKAHIKIFFHRWGPNPHLPH